MLIVYALTIFVSATLLFLVQPMFGRMVLPMLGGTPAVWNTAIVFYQAMLLAGYIYAHLTTKWLGVRRQVLLHLGLLFLPLLLLPISIPHGWTPPTASNPIPWLLALLSVSVGLPFFVVSASSPLLQKWFSNTGHRSSADPYFLYAASNFGSMLALLSYPALIEPHLRLVYQSQLWAVGYGVLMVLLGTCGIYLWRSPALARQTSATNMSPADTSAGLTVRRRARWVMLALIPSGLMLNVTTYLSTDIAAIPLLWVVPLAIYLLTFILVFASKPLIPHKLMVRALPIVLLPLLVVLMARATQPVALVMPLHLLAFFVVTMVCHGELARDRPSTRHLTEFYLWMSVGGVLGGILNALIAPLIFTTVAEYPLTLVLACLIGPATQPSAQTPEAKSQRLRDLAFPAALFAMAIAMVFGSQALGLHAGPASTGIQFGVPALVCFRFSRRPIRFGLGVAAILFASTLSTNWQGHVVYAERSFFGIQRVTLADDGAYRMLVMGSTLHGMQSLDPAREREPLTYYYSSGPLGQLFASLKPEDPTGHVAVIGLGTGSVACYGMPGQPWTFYEIDPNVERIARDPRYFTYLRDCPPHTDVVLGDARLSLAKATSHQYRLMILDAYSSDAIPIHLITREALQLYLDKLAPHGMLAFHISNRHLDLQPVLANLAQDAGLVARVETDTFISPADSARGKTGSQWLIMARATADLGTLATDQRWQPAEPVPSEAVWTDDFSSILSVFKWK